MSKKKSSKKRTTAQALPDLVWAKARKRGYGGTKRQLTQAAETRKAIRKLKKLGILKTKSKKPGGSIYAQLKKLAPVLRGEAAIVKAPAKVRTKYKGVFPSRHGKIVVPKRKDERVRLSKKTGELTATAERFGVKIKSRRLTAREREQGELLEWKSNQVLLVQLPTWAAPIRFKRPSDLRFWLQFYQNREFFASGDFLAYAKLETIGPLQKGE